MTYARTENIKLLRTLLSDIITSPYIYTKNTSLIQSLKSQGGLAALNAEFETESGVQLNIIAMSLNTLKTYANLVLDGGFTELNVLRIRALDSCTRAETKSSLANKRSKAGLTIKVSDLEIELMLHKQSNIVLLQALVSALADFKNISEAEDRALRAKRAADASNTIRSIVSLTPSPMTLVSFPPNPQTVVNIDRYRGKP